MPWLRCEDLLCSGVSGRGRVRGGHSRMGASRRDTRMDEYEEGIVECGQAGETSEWTSTRRA